MKLSRGSLVVLMMALLIMLSGVLWAVRQQFLLSSSSSNDIHPRAGLVTPLGKNVN